MKNVNKLTTLAIAASFALVGLSSTIATASPSNRAARKAAAEKCGIPKHGEGRMTEEQKACMETAGFSKPMGHHRGGKKGAHVPPATTGEVPPADEPAAQ